MTIPTIKLNILLFFSVCLRALHLQNPHVIFEVDSLLFAKQLARHLPWACRSENLSALHQQINNVYMFVIPFQLFTSRGTFVIFIASSNRPQIHCPIRRSMSVIRMVFHHSGNVQSAHHVYLSLSLSCIHSVRFSNYS